MVLTKTGEENEEEKQSNLDSQIRKYNLEELSEEDKEQAHSILFGLKGTGIIALGSKAVDKAKIDLLKKIIEQNWLIIKMLNEIKNK